MEGTSGNQIVPPHLNAEMYRSDVSDSSTIKYLDYIRLNTDGSVLVGCSELTGRYWTGAVKIFNSVLEGEDQKKPQKDISLVSGTPDGCFIDPTKIVLCEDNGTVSIWSSNNDTWKIWQQDITVSEHDDAVMAVDCLDPGKEYVTVGADGNIKVWDINEMICIRNYSAAHDMPIYGVAVKPQSTTNFATASLDEYVTLWDDNICKPVIDLVKNDCGVRCLQWLDENRVVFGDEAGVLQMVDSRNPGIILKLTEFPAAVHHIAVQYESKKVAVCCDNKIVSVCEINDEKCSVVYHDRHMHNNYVRGLAWDVGEKKTLHTVGWDGEIKTHKINN